MAVLKLQTQISIDGFIGAPDGGLDWITWNWGNDIKNYVDELHNTVDMILLGRKMTDRFINYWLNAVKDKKSPDHEFGKLMIDYPKVVFSKTVKKHDWVNTSIASGDLKDEVNKLKKKQGKDIIAYGGAEFVSSLIKEDLIDEYHLFVNPAMLGKGLQISGLLDKTKQLKLKKAAGFDCGIVLHHYERA